MIQGSISAEQAYRNKKISIAKAGLLLAWLSSVTCICQTMFNNIGTPIISANFEDRALITAIIAITLLGMSDFFSGIYTLIYNVATKRSIKEYRRMCGMKISWTMLLAALAAGPFATGCWMSSSNMCGVTYTTAILALTPAVTAIMGHFVFKEKLGARVVFGIAIVIIGTIINGWAKPEGMDYFYIGVLLAALAPIGFSLEGMISTYASDMVDPLVACGFFRCFGAGILGLVGMAILSAATGYSSVYTGVISTVFSNPIAFFSLAMMGLFGAIGYGTTYAAFNKCGPTRTLAIVYTMPVWSVPIGLAFAAATPLYTYSVTPLALVGVVIIIVGMVLVVAKPSELFSLRNFGDD